MSEKEVCRYLELVDRRLFIMIHSGIGWKPEYVRELETIDKELAGFRELVKKAHGQKKTIIGKEWKRMQETIKCPEMVTIKTAAERTGLSYDAIRKMCLEGKIVYIKAGCKFLVNFGKFVDYLNGEAVEDVKG